MSSEKHILVVEDSPTTLKILVKGLSSLGYKVHGAVHGVEAFDFVSKYPIDLLLTDLNMPEMDGFELIEGLRSLPQFLDLPIIVFTSKGDNDSMRRALDAGANIYLHKPAPLPKLRYKVESLLGGDGGEGFSGRNTQELRENLEVKKENPKLRRRTKALAPDVHLEVYLYAESKEEEEELLAELLGRRDLAITSVLPFLIEEGMTETELLRLFRLMAEMKNEAFAAPLFARYHDYDGNTKLRHGALRALAACGGEEYRQDIQELYHSEIRLTVKMDQDMAELLGAFEEILEQV